MSDPIITVENLSKRYVIGHQRARGDGLRHSIEQAARHPVDWLRDRKRKLSEKHEEFWALKGASLQINRGEVVGVLGRNGAGKSTLLKILSRITEPTTGRVHLKGRVASLLEVGTGFHQELTGRENIYLNGAILGMRRAEIRRKFDEIVAFSEVEKFLDTPVKRFSSGMYVRLAFAVAAHLESDILLIDEVLAVGDLSFQKKCLGKMGDVAEGGRTILFVSHNLEAIRGLCKRGILFEDGMIKGDGAAGDVLESYLESFSQSPVCLENKDYGLTIHKVALKNDRGQETREFSPGDDLVVEVAFTAQTRVEKPYFILLVQGANGNCFAANMLLDGHRPEVLASRGTVTCRFKAIPLLPQRYEVRMAIRANNGKDPILNYQDVASFNVKADLAEYGYRGEFQMLAATSTSVVVPYEWQLPDGTTAAVALRGSCEAI